MQIHGRAKLGPAGRLVLCQAIEGGMTFRQAAACLNVSPATAHRWWRRYAQASLAERHSLAWSSQGRRQSANCRAGAVRVHLQRCDRNTGCFLLCVLQGLADRPAGEVAEQHLMRGARDRFIGSLRDVSDTERCGAVLLPEDRAQEPTSKPKLDQRARGVHCAPRARESRCADSVSKRGPACRAIAIADGGEGRWQPQRSWLPLPPGRPPSTAGGLPAARV